MNPALERLQAYPFERLTALLADATPAALPPINLSVGEPQHPPPQAALQSIAEDAARFGRYPMIRGEDTLREACLAWLCRRFGLEATTLDPARHVLALNGTREGLFAVAQCLMDRADNPVVVMPNPLYQIYEGAALLAGAEPHYVNCTEERGFLPEFDAVADAVWRRCRLVYVCTPDNPSGAVLPQATLQALIERAHRFDFTVVSDECYCDVYFDEAAPPQGLLATSQALGNAGHAHCLAFYSLSKRSNLPGLRSGFVAGDEKLIAEFLRFRTYHGCSMPPPLQRASAVAWRDERHVVENRRLYRTKFTRFIEIVGDKLALRTPAAGFYLWPNVGGDDERFVRALYEQKNVTTLPGAYLAREAGGVNPGKGRVRIALVAAPEVCEEAAGRLRDFLEKNPA